MTDDHLAEAHRLAMLAQEYNHDQSVVPISYLVNAVLELINHAGQTPRPIETDDTGVPLNCLAKDTGTFEGSMAAQAFITHSVAGGSTGEEAMELWNILAPSARKRWLAVAEFFIYELRERRREPDYHA